MTITINYKILIWFLIIPLFIVAKTAFAVDSTTSAAQKYGITFPVVELGNCNSLDVCRSYCSDTNNQQACMDFAKKHNLQKNQPKPSGDLMSFAKQELGCDSSEACKAFCGEQTNWERCGEFAKKHQLTHPKPSESPNPELLTKAKELLGCTSNDSCKVICNRTENREKCMNLSRTIQELKQKIPPIVSNNCQYLKDKLASGSATPETIRSYYEKYCLRSQMPVPSVSGITKEEYCRMYPDHCNSLPKPSYHPETRPATSSGVINTQSVKGISTERNLVQKVLSWFGF